ncbi:MAG: glycosyltransferase [Verrucomicrobia bacterium]|nr:glycosyltransferase [Verrucomicrobiota bacterium]
MSHIGKMIRCYESMARQSGCEWGAVVIDDGSDELSREACRRVFGYASNITLLQPRRRRGQLANTVLAIRRLCKNPNTVIITLDMDDALIGNDVLLTLKREYETGADLTVGSMVRTDKDAKYPATFSDLHTSRGGSVWQHLRSFHKKLFDGIPDWRLRIDGSYVTICVDWAFMIPIAEQSKSPRYITDKLYYYETSGLRQS